MSLRRLYSYRGISPIRLQHRGCKDLFLVKTRLESERKERHGVPTEEFPGETGFPQAGDPENHMGRPAEIRDPACRRFRSLRDGVVSLPKGATHGVLRAVQSVYHPFSMYHPFSVQKNTKCVFIII